MYHILTSHKRFKKKKSNISSIFHHLKIRTTFNFYTSQTPIQKYSNFEIELCVKQWHEFQHNFPNYTKLHEKQPKNKKKKRKKKEK